MSATDFFASNWAYLDTEFSWLERQLMVSVAQQRKHLRSVNKVAKTASDRATSSWWQGLITVPSPDSKRPRRSPQRALSYHQALADRVQHSQKRGVCLGLPALQTALDLSLFEKNLVLMALAPEYRTRYGRLYHYLQTGRDCPSGALPTLELALRLLCRSDRERRRGRAQIGASSKLRSHKILTPIQPPGSTLLGSSLQLAPQWVDYLLAENPDPQWPPQQLRLTGCAPPADWEQVILPPTVKTQMQTALTGAEKPVLLVGAPGTGKTLIARAAAAEQGHSLRIVDPAQEEAESRLQALADCPAVLIKAAHRWLGHTADPEIAAAVRHRLAASGSTIWLTTEYRHLVRPIWRRQLTILEVPKPGTSERLQLWHQAFPNGVRFMGPARWQSLAAGLKLSGGEIEQLATAARQVAKTDPVALDHLQQVLGDRWQLR